MRTHPLYYDPRDAHDMYRLRGFRTKAETVEARASIETLHSLFKLLSARCFRVWSTFLSSYANDHESTVYTLFFTLFAQFSLHRRLTVRPLSDAEFRDLLQEAFSGNKDAVEIREIRYDLKANFINELQKSSEEVLSKKEFAGLRSVFDGSFRNAEEELSLLNPEMKINNNYIHCILLRS
jgi:hypothetical protein